MWSFFRSLFILSSQFFFIAPALQLTIDHSCYLYPNFSPTAALASAKSIGTISKAWLTYYRDNYDQKDVDEERLQIVEEGLAATFGLLSLRQPELEDWHRQVIKDDIETIITVFDQTANNPPDDLDIRCNLDWLSEKHDGKSYKKDVAFHQPDDGEVTLLANRKRMTWLWSEIHQRWLRGLPKRELCQAHLGFAEKSKGNTRSYVQICPAAIERANQHSELRQLRDQPEGVEFPRRSLDDVGETVASLLFHELTHTNAKTRDETYVDQNGKTITAYRLARVKGLANRAQGEARQDGKVVQQGDPLRNADTFLYFGIGGYKVNS
ncbi:hypothetical protein N7492_005844 [Penicillium capsulatum]|uniref:Lysine-specific metallo-endopeptidase domain-containing protein n=1 Tax=Penicillium capsulatum TaxID=69766 RepID=A0A9W9ID71_9EURO|nr:hypothetical protein N7492_005844 [Penicillium capsulatum]KAJ6135056.1 hypothetical protein N7512_000216 [Penicillium capsulatum]